MSNSWPDPAKPGIPPDPGQVGWHWLRKRGHPPCPALWLPPEGLEPEGRWGTWEEGDVLDREYLGPIPFPDLPGPPQDGPWDGADLEMRVRRMSPDARITLGPTDEVAFISPVGDADQVPARVWKGTSAGGVPVNVLIVGIAVAMDDRVAWEFETDASDSEGDKPIN